MAASDRVNLVLVAADTLRPDHLHCYGYPWPTSPHIDRIAAQGAHFTDYHAAQIPTHPAFTTLFSGMDPMYHSILSHSGPRQLSTSVPLLAERLQAAGYVTCGIDNMMSQQSAPGWFARGFDYFRVYRYTPGIGQARPITDWAVDFVHQVEADPQPFALFIHYFDPHTPYAPPAAFKERFYDPASANARIPVRSLFAPEDELAPHLLGGLAEAGADLAYVLAQYDGEIGFMDEQLGRLFSAVDALADSRKTLVVFLSDHGEAFGEGGLYFDHHTLHDAVTRCALAMRLPGVIPAGQTVDGLASSMDVTPTILDLLHLPSIEPAAMAGRSLVPLLHGSASVRDHAPLGEASRQISVGVVTKEWRLIEPVTQTASGQPVGDFLDRPRSPAPVLYQRDTDPNEEHDVAAEHPDVVAQLADLIQQRREATMAFTGVADPFRHALPTLPYKLMVERHHRYATANSTPAKPGSTS